MHPCTLAEEISLLVLIDLEERVEDGDERDEEEGEGGEGGQGADRWDPERDVHDFPASMSDSWTLISSLA